MSKNKSFVSERILDIEELYNIAKTLTRHNIRRAVAKGILDYKESFEKLNVRDMRVKSFSAYMVEALVFLTGIAIGKTDAECAFNEVFTRMKQIAEEME